MAIYITEKKWRLRSIVPLSLFLAIVAPVLTVIIGGGVSSLWLELKGWFYHNYINNDKISLTIAIYEAYVISLIVMLPIYGACGFILAQTSIYPRIGFAIFLIAALTFYLLTYFYPGIFQVHTIWPVILNVTICSYAGAVLYLKNWTLKN